MKRTTLLALAIAYFLFGGAPLPIDTFKTISAEAATKAQWRYAKRKCRRKYGKRLVKTRIGANGRITCTFRRKSTRRRAMTYERAAKLCAQNYRDFDSVVAIKKLGKWYCLTRE